MRSMNNKQILNNKDGEQGREMQSRIHFRLPSFTRASEKQIALKHFGI